MMGVQTFPTPLEGHSLFEFKTLVDKYSKFGISFGYSDHLDPKNELSKVLPMAAFSLGADFIEKHFTDNRKKRTDYQSAMDENEIKNFINLFYQFKGTSGQ